MQQLFHDFNFKVKPVPERVAIALDHSDLYIGLTNLLGRLPLVQRLGGMEFKSASLGKKSTAIVVQQNLLRFVRGGAEGERFIEGTTKSELAKPNLTEESIDSFEERMTVFLEGFVEPDLAAAGRRIGAINWDRSNPVWAEIVRERVDKEGNTMLGLAAGGGQNLAS